jgi:renalase
VGAEGRRHASSLVTSAHAAPKVVVLGAGISGLLAARDLQQAGASVVVIDKARGVGGRLATRRLGEGVADHGAQFFTARTEAFAAELAGWLADGVAAPGFSGVLGAAGIVADDGELRYRGVPAMTGIAKHLARSLDVRLRHRATGIHHDGRRWHIDLDLGLAADTDGSGTDLLAADALVLTTPAPQLLELLDPAALDAVDRLALESIAYDPCIAVMVAVDAPDPLHLAPVGARRPSSEPLAWVADNQVKGISATPTITIHAGPETSRQLWDLTDEAVVEALTTPAGLDPASIQAASVQRWRYAHAAAWHPATHLALRTPVPAVVAGDAFGASGRVEGASISGLSAARHLGEQLALG